MKKTLVLKEDGVSNYLFEKRSNFDVANYYIVKQDSLIFKIARKFSIKILCKLLINNWKSKINEYNKIILFDTGYSDVVTKYIKKHNSNCIIYLWYWNSINDYSIRYLKDKNVDKFYSYNKADCKKYNLNYNSQLYNSKIKLKKCLVTNDILFIGANKGRKKLILKYDNIFKNKDLRTNIIITETKKDYISYDKYLELLSKSNCILDITDNNINGLTLRCLESLFLEKKLITNNKNIANYDFYDSDNIFILEKDNIDSIKNFITKPYKKIDNKIINYYNYIQWLERFK